MTSPAPAPATPPPPPLLGWRLLALAYDALIALGLWFAVAAGFTLAHGDAVRGDWLGLLELVALWLVTGAYATLSWRRGGQTIGMRAWRLVLRGRDGGAPGWGHAWARYAVATLSLLAAGLGFWWAWIDRGRLTWHDRAGRTRILRLPR